MTPRHSSAAAFSAPPPNSDAQTQFKHARQVFDECDSLRESYWEFQRRGEKKQAEAAKEEAKQLLATLGLAGAGIGQARMQGEVDREWSYQKGDAGGEHNRWANVRPWDHAMLPEPYLNASTIPPLVWAPLKDIKTLQPFVASQAPLPNTFSTFWHHFLSSGARLVVNLTPVYDAYGMNKVRKSHQYWPDHRGEPFDAGDGWEVELVSQTKHTTRSKPASDVQSEAEARTTAPPAAKSMDRATGSSGSGSSSSSGRSSGPGGLNTSTGSSSSSGSRRGSQQPSTQPDKDWTIVRRDLLIRPPEKWEPAPLASYVDALYDCTGTGPHHSPTAVNRANSDGSGWPVTLLHVDAWADGGADSSLNFCRLVDLVQETQRRLCPASSSPVPPIWVHCSAGIGRTGTLVAGMMARALASSHEPTLRAYPAEKIVLILWRYLRERRYGMITTPQQAMMVADEIERVRRGMT